LRFEFTGMLNVAAGLCYVVFTTAYFTLCSKIVSGWDVIVQICLPVTFKYAECRLSLISLKGKAHNIWCPVLNGNKIETHVMYIYLNVCYIPPEENMLRSKI